MQSSEPLSNLPVMSKMCASCPFHSAGWTYIRKFLMERALNEGSVICHSTGPEALDLEHLVSKEPLICRGARNFQQEFLHAIGFLEAPDDSAWMRKCEELGLPGTVSKSNKDVRPHYDKSNLPAV